MCNKCDSEAWETLMRSAVNSIELEGYHHITPVPESEEPRGLCIDGFYTAADLRKLATALENAHA